MFFIESIAKIVQRLAPKYNIKVCSPIIAQAILESALGTSELAVQAHNYFGLKYNNKQPNRCPTATGKYIKKGSEQLPSGEYISSVMEWQKFPSMEAGVQGYFDFLNYSSRYNNLKNITDPSLYTALIKKDGYATSLNYVSSVMDVIDKYNLRDFDIKGEINMSNSPLVVYTKLSPNVNSPRNHKIDKITIHHMAGNLSIEACLNMFARPSRKGSCNYAIGTDGRIGLGANECDRAWTSSNRANDMRAITIEVANDGGAPNWHVSDKAMAALIDLCVDICQRNSIPRLNFTGKSNGNLTMHKMFTATACPGPYLESKFPYIAAEVNRRLKGVNPKPSNPDCGIEVGEVIQLTEDAEYTSGKPIPKWVINSITYARDIRPNSDVVFSTQKVGPITGVTKQIYIKKDTPANGASYKVKVLDNNLNIRSGPGTGYGIVNQIRDHGIYTIVQEQNGWGKLKSGAGWISLNYTEKV